MYIHKDVSGNGRVVTALLFDMDGLMVDTERLYIQANQIVAREHGKEVTMATISKMVGRSTIESLGIFADDLGISTLPVELSVQRQDVMLRLIRAGLEAMPGLREVLEFARPRMKLGLATGSPAGLMQEVLVQLDLVGFFDVTMSSDGIRLGKPHPEIYLKTCAQLGVSPEHCIVLEDSGSGVRAGAAAGCYVIAVPTEHTREHDLSPAHVVVASLHEAREHIAAML